MKKSYLLGVTAIASLGLISMNSLDNSSIETYKKSVGHMANSSGAIDGVTGAPGENNCTQCHIGNAQDGSNQNVLTLLDGVTPVTQYIPGNTYSVAVSMTTGNIQEGFCGNCIRWNRCKSGYFFRCRCGWSFCFKWY